MLRRDSCVLDRASFRISASSATSTGHIRVKRVSRAGLFWGVAEIYENDVLTRLMPPGSELEPPEECTGGPPQCRTRTTRVVTRDAP